MRIYEQASPQGKTKFLRIIARLQVFAFMHSNAHKHSQTRSVCKLLRGSQQRGGIRDHKPLNAITTFVVPNPNYSTPNRAGRPSMRNVAFLVAVSTKVPSRFGFPQAFVRQNPAKAKEQRIAAS